MNQPKPRYQIAPTYRPLPGELDAAPCLAEAPFMLRLRAERDRLYRPKFGEFDPDVDDGCGDNNCGQCRECRTVPYTLVLIIVSASAIDQPDKQSLGMDELMEYCGTGADLARITEAVEFYLTHGLMVRV